MRRTRAGKHLPPKRKKNVRGPVSDLAMEHLQSSMATQLEVLNDKDSLAERSKAVAQGAIP